MFFSISKQHLDLYAPYPIYSAYEADCNFENSETGDYCDGGFLRNAKGEYKILNDGTVEKCPCCSEKRIAGPGSFLEVPIPNQTEGVADMRNPVQITTIDKDSLDYNVNECARLKNEIVITLEDKGCFYDNQIIPSIKLKTIDSTGAGDIFHGAFTYYLSRDYDIINVLKLANYAGAISVSRIGTRNSIPTKEEMEAVYNEFK